MEETRSLQGCIARLRVMFPALTAAESRVAEYILENPQHPWGQWAHFLALLCRRALFALECRCQRCAFGARASGHHNVGYLQQTMAEVLNANFIRSRLGVD